MDTHQRMQLSFDVGGRRPDDAAIKLSGALTLQAELAKGAQIHIRVSGEDGEIIAEGYGRVTGVSFDDEFDDFGEVCRTTRQHKIKLA